MLFLYILFFLPLLLLLHSYILYPISVWGLARVIKKNYFVDENFQPNISILISAYNEEKVIEKTIRNFLASDYNKNKMEIIIGSDKSDDNTNEIVMKLMREIPQIKFFQFENRRGKAQVLNDLVKNSNSEILIFSDANTIYDKNAIKNLVKFYKDERIGGVSGKLILINSKEATEAALYEKTYWDFETILKEKEGQIGGLIGANGGIYSIKKSYFELIPTTFPVMDDFYISLKVLTKKKAFLYVNEARAYEYVAPNWQVEYNRKVRNNSIMMSTIKAIKELLKFDLGFVSYGLWSHKIIRWFTPLLLLLLFFTNFSLIGISDFYFGFFVLQIIFYFISVIGYYMEKNNKYNKLFFLCFYFSMTNIAMLIGIYKFFSKRHTGFWQSTLRIYE